MEDNNINNNIFISIRDIINKLKKKKFLFLKTLSLTFILSCIWIFPQPRYYTAEVMLAPEANDDSGIGGLSSIASSFGFNLGGMSGSDAIYPELYPDLMSSTDFIVGLFNINVKSLDGTIDTDLYNYEATCQKSAFYNKPIVWIKKQIRGLFSKNTNNSASEKIDPFMLTERQSEIVEKMKGDIYCNVDKLTSVFVIRAKAQDPLIAATIADSVRLRLQDAIIKYRTSKSSIDVKHYEALVMEAKNDYDSIQTKYAKFCDSHKDAFMQTVLLERDDMENEMQLKYNIYTTMTASLQTAKAKLQERTPAFTVLQNASVPVKPAGPKRMLFVGFMMIVAFFGTTIYILKDDLKKSILLYSKGNK